MATESAELGASYAACAAEVRQFLPALWTAGELLPAPTVPHMHALHAFMSRSDRLADEGPVAQRERRLSRWRRETMADLRTGTSAHPMRRALVDTACRWDLDRALFEEFFDALRADCVSAPEFETFDDLRRYLRGATGTIARLWGPLLELTDRQASAALCALGELCQLVDIFEDFPLDLKNGRCYLPRADMSRLGVAAEDLHADERHEELDALMGIQLAHGRRLLEQAIPAVAIADAAYQPFLQTMLLGAQVQLDEVDLLRSQVLTEGVEPLALIGPRSGSPVPLDAGPVPTHIAVIMDGNRRWAAQRGLPTAQGHRAGEWAVMRTIHAMLRLGVRYLSVYAFSTENWSRSQDELIALFETMAAACTRSIEWLHAHGVRVRWCGRRDRIDTSLASALALVESMTSNNSALTLTVCADYGGREELAAAARALAAEAVAGTIRPEEIGPADLARHLYVPELPDVDLLIRTSGDQRVSNFLPWQLAYAEFVFDPVPWPDFGLVRLRDAVNTYAGRRRRFGGDLAEGFDPGEPARTD